MIRCKPAGYRRCYPRALSCIRWCCHSLTPGAVVDLAALLYGARPDAYILAIAGHDYREVKEGLSVDAAGNLQAATAFFLDYLKTGARPIRPEPAPLSAT